ETKQSIYDGLLDFWYLALILIALIGTLVYIGIKTQYKETQTRNSNTSKKIFNNYYVKNSLYFCIGVFVFIILARGGFQLRPIDLLDAHKYAKSQNTALVLNTPFVLGKTLYNLELSEKKYFIDLTELQKHYTAHHTAKWHPQTIQNLNEPLISKESNVVVIIVESLSYEYIDSVFTPFLYHLFKQSAYYKCYANGNRSNEAFPILAASLPSLMDKAFTISPYADIPIESLATYLKNRNYKSAFFHGGTNGTMMHNAFAASADFDAYFGRSEYNNEDDFDGRWGIFDDKFLQFTAQKIDKMPQPFLAYIYTLSSHHPYTIPKKYKNKFPKGPIPILESIAYADFSLAQFFATIQKMPWYKNTLFVITSDHSSQSYTPTFSGEIEKRSIPLAFYYPNTKITEYTKPNLITQQCDVMPSILHLLSYSKPFWAYGESVFDSSAPHFSINYQNGRYQLIKDGFVLNFEQDAACDLFDYRTDKNLSRNLIHLPLYQSKKKELEKFVQAYIQDYNHYLIRGKHLDLDKKLQ
ncbi:MAG: LTA synthase family protein, partial [Bacteroidales bacterium]